MSEKKEARSIRYYIDEKGRPCPVSTLSERNYWRRLIVAHMASHYDWSQRRVDELVLAATRIVNELERIEAEESKAKE